MIASLLVALLAAQTPQICGPKRIPVFKSMHAIGDSIIVGTCSPSPPPTVLATYAPSWLIINSGIVGNTVAQIRSRYTLTKTSACNGEPCSVLWLEGGINSLRASVTPAATLADMTWIVDDALADGKRVIWQGIHPYAGFSGAGINPVQQASTYNALMREACNARAENGRLQCFFPYAEFESTSNPGYLRDELTCDGVHLVQTGSNRLGALAFAALQALL